VIKATESVPNPLNTPSITRSTMRCATLWTKYINSQCRIMAMTMRCSMIFMP
jgi:hypothetical protein